MSRFSTTALTLALAVFVTAISFTLLVASWYLINNLLNPPVRFISLPASLYQ